MSTDFQTAFTLLIVGMISVFAILLLLMVFGKMLIRIVNRYFPEPPKAVVLPTTTSAVAGTGTSPQKLAVLTAAVSTITQGRGRISSVEKLE